MLKTGVNEFEKIDTVFLLNFIETRFYIKRVLVNDVYSEVWS